MAIYIKEGEIIEGKKADVIARRAEWKGLKEEPITGKKMTLYELDRNSSVEITRCHSSVLLSIASAAAS